MTPPPKHLQRRARGGKGLLPPNPKQWDNEHNGLDLREEMGLSLDSALSHDAAFALLRGARLVGHGQIPMARMFIDHFRGAGSTAWSGMGISLPGGGIWIVFNDSHPVNRVRATLMEEFFHLWLNHPTTAIRVYQDVGSRSHDPRVEGIAYGSGAAALVPFRPLRERLRAGESIGKIATFFEVSRELVLFRAKVTKLYHAIRVF